MTLFWIARVPGALMDSKGNVWPGGFFQEVQLPDDRPEVPRF